MEKIESKQFLGKKVTLLGTARDAKGGKSNRRRPGSRGVFGGLGRNLWAALASGTATQNAHGSVKLEYYWVKLLSSSGLVPLIQRV